MNANEIKSVLLEAEYGSRTVGFAVKELCDLLEAQEARIKALEDARTTQIQTQDASAAEELPIVTCGWCGNDAVRFRVTFEAGHKRVFYVAPCCADSHGKATDNDMIYITGEPARLILESIARAAKEAAK